MIPNILIRIEERESKLQYAAVELKKHFVGIDHIIDRIIDNIKAWYILPEVSTRPTIVNLWGLTGVGKTDLVRRLVRLLDFSNKFLEIQLKSKSGESMSLESTMEYSSLGTSDPGILLLDEIQQFRSIDEDGAEIRDYGYQDIWTLLSDGKFSTSVSRYNNMLELLFRTMYSIDYWETHRDEEDEASESKKSKYNRSYYDAQHLKKLLCLEESVLDIMKWDTDKYISTLEEHIKDSSTYISEPYSKLLILISGNLDEAYGMANSVNDSDIDANVLHEHSKHINLVTVKAALQKRFKPEQIARFGNTHVIYPSLNRASYEEIINRKITEITDNVTERTGIILSVHDSIKSFIYRNGVFPAQGTRPLFSTITSVFENALPSIILHAIKNGDKTSLIQYNDNFMIYTTPTSTDKRPLDGDLDSIRNKVTDDQKTSNAVHEAGHAIIYAIVHKLAPTQIVINTSVNHGGGFIGSHTIDESKKSLFNEICTGLGGRAAETIIFGKENINAGASRDIHVVTNIATKMVRAYGMYDNISKIVPQGCTHDNCATVNNDSSGTNAIIESILTHQLNRAKTIIKDNLDLFRATVDFLLEKLTIKPDEFKKLCGEYGIEINVASAEKVIYDNYAEMYKNNHGIYRNEGEDPN